MKSIPIDIRTWIHDVAQGVIKSSCKREDDTRYYSMTNKPPIVIDSDRGDHDLLSETQPKNGNQHSPIEEARCEINHGKINDNMTRILFSTSFMLK